MLLKTVVVLIVCALESSVLGQSVSENNQTSTSIQETIVTPPTSTVPLAVSSTVESKTVSETQAAPKEAKVESTSVSSVVEITSSSVAKETVQSTASTVEASSTSAQPSPTPVVEQAAVKVEAAPAEPAVANTPAQVEAPKPEPPVQRPAPPAQRAQAPAPRPQPQENRPAPPPVVIAPQPTTPDATTEVVRKAAVTSSAATETLAPVIQNIPPPPPSAPSAPSSNGAEQRSGQPIVNQAPAGSPANQPASASNPLPPVANTAGGSAVVQDSTAAPAAVPANSSPDLAVRPQSPVGFSPTPYATPNSASSENSTSGSSSSSLPIPIIAAAAGGCLLVLVGGFVIYRKSSQDGPSLSSKFFKQPEDQRDPEAPAPVMEDNKRGSENIFRAEYLPPLQPLADESYGNLTPSMISSVVTTDSMYFESAPLPPTPPMLPPLGHFERLEADRNRFSSILSEDVMSLRTSSPSPSVSNPLQRPDLVTAALRMATTDSNRSSVSSVSSLESSVYSEERESTYTMGTFEFSETSLL